MQLCKAEIAGLQESKLEESEYGRRRATYVLIDDDLDFLLCRQCHFDWKVKYYPSHSGHATYKVPLDTKQTTDFNDWHAARLESLNGGIICDRTAAGSTKFKGVSKVGSGRFRARESGGKRVVLGTFDTAEEAALAVARHNRMK